MKKKWIMLGGAVGISSIVMVTTGFSALASTTGYDAYKSALKNTKAASNVSVQAAASLQDNGNVLADLTSNLKVNLSNETASGTVDMTANSSKQSLAFFKQNNQTVLKPSASDVYYVKQEGKGRHQHDDNESKDEAQTSQQIETVIDALVGNLKDYVNVDSQADGSKQISVQLDNTQIPTVVNAIAPIAIKEATKKENDGEKQDDTQAPALFQKDLLKNAAPQLSQDIKIEKVSIKASVNASNYIEHQEADLTVSGKDDNGASHQVTLHVQADLSDFNNTTPESIDLTGKNVQTLKRGHEGRNNNKE